MRNRLQLYVTPLLIAAQVAHIVPVSAADSTTAKATVETKQNVTLNLNSPKVIEVKAKPDFDTDVLVPLRAAQAAKAKAEAEANAARLKALRVSRKVAGGPVTGDVWYRLRMCESGNNYARVSRTGKYHGAYQYDIGTWANFGGYARADLAPAEVQDEKARQTQARRGWSPWPSCARKLGLL